MKPLWLLLCAITLGTWENCARGEIATRVINYSNIPVRVLLGRERQAITVTATGPSLYFGQSPLKGWKPLGKTATILLSGGAGKPWAVRLNGRNLPYSHFYLKGGRFSSETVQYRSHPYRGLLKIIPVEGSLLIVNVLLMENYLAGILASEMGATWEMNALKAQAIASRTYALYMTMHPKSPLYDVVDSMLDQVYRGASSESPRILQAVSGTQGQFLGINEEPIKLFFHSRCGGQTDTENSVWETTKTSHVRVQCPYCQKHPYRWSTSIPTHEIMEVFRVPLSKEPPSLIVAGRSLSGRVTALKVGSKSTETVINADVFRNMLGYHRIRSARFSWQVVGDQTLFVGTGLGHGVGMCQWGANYLAKQGHDYHQILRHYYPNLKIYEPELHPSPPYRLPRKAVAKSGVPPRTTVID